MPTKPHEKIAELKRRANAGPQILRYAFRPFFLLAGFWATLSIPLWIAQFAGFGVLPASVDPFTWHQHEMMFGFIAAAVAGFILTAIPNWTGNLPVSGWRLAFLVFTWLIGRAAFFVGDMAGPLAGPWMVAILDMAFLTSLCAVIARELISGRSWHNLPPLLLISGLGVGNLLTHLERIGLAATNDLGIRLAILMMVLLLALIGGRVVPSFTRNWLAKRGVETLPAPFAKFDKLAIGALGFFVVAALVAPMDRVTGVLALIAGVLNAIRLFRWRGYLVLRVPLLWVLHLGYGWLSAGVAMYGLAALGFAISQNAALHAITAGAFGTMILGVASRASLGHTGRALTAGRGTVICYLMVSVSTIARIAASYMGAGQMIALTVAAIAWSIAFGLFTILYFPVFTGPRVSET